MSGPLLLFAQRSDLFCFYSKFVYCPLLIPNCMASCIHYQRLIYINKWILCFGMLLCWTTVEFSRFDDEGTHDGTENSKLSLFFCYLLFLYSITISVYFKRSRTILYIYRLCVLFRCSFVQFGRQSVRTLYIYYIHIVLTLLNNWSNLSPNNEINTNFSFVIRSSFVRLSTYKQTHKSAVAIADADAKYVWEYKNESKSEGKVCVCLWLGSFVPFFIIVFLLFLLLLLQCHENKRQPFMSLQLKVVYEKERAGEREGEKAEEIEVPMLTHHLWQRFVPVSHIFFLLLLLL